MAVAGINYYQKIKAKRISFLALTSIVVISVVSTLAFGPQVMALVEPHITITMDPSQATKPFQVNDDQGTNVFSINPDSTFSSVNYADLVFKQESEVNVIAGQNLTNPVILAEWKLTKKPGITDSAKTFSSISITATGLKTNTENRNLFCGLIQSSDEMTWQSIRQVVFTTNQFTNKFESTGGGAMQSNPLFLASACWGSEDVVVGTIKEITINARMNLPVGYSIERIL